MEKLDSATDVVALLTSHSLNRPWILYEAGVAKGKLDTTVFGVALGIPLGQVNTGPFSQFQNSGDDVDSLCKVVKELISRSLPEASPRMAAIEREVNAFREIIGPLVAGTPTQAEQVAEPEPDAGNVARLFEELKVMIREAPLQTEGRPVAAGPRLSSRLLSFVARDIPSSNLDVAANAWVTLITAARDVAPWLYEDGLTLYRAMRRGEPQAVRREARRLQRQLNGRGRMLYGEYAHAVGFDRDAVDFARELPSFVSYFLDTVAMALSDNARAKPQDPDTGGDAETANTETE